MEALSALSLSSKEPAMEEVQKKRIALFQKLQAEQKEAREAKGGEPIKCVPVLAFHETLGGIYWQLIRGLHDGFNNYDQVLMMMMIFLSMQNYYARWCCEGRKEMADIAYGHCQRDFSRPCEQCPNCRGIMWYLLMRFSL